MYAKQLWYGRLTIFSLCALTHSAQAGYAIYTYLSLSATTEAVILEANLETIDSNRYAPRVCYQYTLNGKIYRESELLTQKVYRNLNAAKEELTTFSQKSCLLSYHPHHPSRSTLQRSFPIKKSFYALTLIGLSLYTIWLGIYIRTRSS